MVGFQSESTCSSYPEDSVIVVLDANRNKGSVDALDWAIKHLAQPKDTVVVLGLLSEVGKRPSDSCFPIQMGTGFTGIRVRLELFGQGELSPKELKEEIERKQEEYQCILQPFNRQCKKNEVKLEAKLAVGYDPRRITVEEAQKFNPRWIILDSHFRKYKVYIYGHVVCNVAVMKGKGVATLMPSKGFPSELCRTDCEENNDVAFTENEHDRHQGENDNSPVNTKSLLTPVTPRSPCWYPLSWRTGFPRAFSLSELEVMTNGFANENVILMDENRVVYEAIYQETPVVIGRYSGNNDQAWSLFKILSRVRHRNIMNLVGYCSTSDSLSLLCDYPCSGTLEVNLKCDELAKNLSWKARWYVALEIGAGIRYLHEECADGPIVDLSLSSCNILLCHGSSALLSLPQTAKWLKDTIFRNASSPAKSCNIEEDERLFADVSAYGTVLIELVSGKTVQPFQESLSLIDWALPLLEEGSLSEVMDPRLTGSSDSTMADQMVHAALLCLKKDLSHKPMISEVLAAVRGDEFAVTIKA